MNDLNEALQILENMGPVKELKAPDFKPPPGHLHCACGKKFIPVGKLKFHNTPVLPGVSDSMCDECLPDVKGMAIIVCVRCKSVVARSPPFRFHSGFCIRAGAYYHTGCCPECDSSVEGKKLFILERHFYELENKYVGPSSK